MFNALTAAVSMILCLVVGVVTLLYMIVCWCLCLMAGIVFLFGLLTGNAAAMLLAATVIVVTAILREPTVRLSN